VKLETILLSLAMDKRAGNHVVQGLPLRIDGGYGKTAEQGKGGEKLGEKPAGSLMEADAGAIRLADLEL
jgi:hypothetical protein